MLWGSWKGVSREFPGHFKKFKECFKEVLGDKHDIWNIWNISSSLVFLNESIESVTKLVAYKSKRHINVKHTKEKPKYSSVPYCYFNDIMICIINRLLWHHKRIHGKRITNITMINNSSLNMGRILNKMFEIPVFQLSQDEVLVLTSHIEIKISQD